ncbi:MAG: tyrosine-protein phosphatase [Blautia sp.]|nr:tyrosine-protein phosphatase [Blautia sp.]
MKKRGIIFLSVLMSSMLCCVGSYANENIDGNAEYDIEEETVSAGETEEEISQEGKDIAEEPEKTQEEEAQEEKAAKTEEIERSLGLTSVWNARELGGYEGADGLIIGGGRLWRSGELSEISAEDKELLQKKGLATIIDLRTTWEAMAEPDGKLGGVRNRLVERYLSKHMESDFENYYPFSPGMKYKTHSLNLLAAMGEDAAGFFERKYTDDYLFSDTALAGYRRVFNLLLSSKYPILIHSGMGKDRTGIVCALILSVLGVERETVIEDYMLSNDYLLEYIEQELIEAQEETGNTDSLGDIFTLCTVDRSWIENAFDAIDTDYGSMENFFHQAMNLTDEEIDELRARFLKDPNAPDVTPVPTETVTPTPAEEDESDDGDEEDVDYGDTVSDLYEESYEPEYYEAPVYNDYSGGSQESVSSNNNDNSNDDYSYGDLGGYSEVAPPDESTPW